MINWILENQYFLFYHFYNQLIVIELKQRIFLFSDNNEQQGGAKAAGHVKITNTNPVC